MEPDILEIILTANEVFQDKFAWKYYRPQDGRTITFKETEAEDPTCYATHETCFFDKDVLCYPWALSAQEKITVVCGPVKEAWQFEELQSLRDLGWTIHYLVDWELISLHRDYYWYSRDEIEQIEIDQNKEKPLLEELALLKARDCDYFLSNSEDTVRILRRDDEKELEFIPSHTTLTIGTLKGIEVRLRNYGRLEYSVAKLRSVLARQQALRKLEDDPFKRPE